MSMLLTDNGAIILSQLWASLSTLDSLTFFRGLFLVSAPAMNRAHGSPNDYDWSDTFTEPPYPILDNTIAQPVAILAGRAIVSWGPPALVFEVLADFTCYGVAFETENEYVVWVDKWDTPREFTTGQVFQYLPSFTMTSECPPLGGCS